MHLFIDGKLGKVMKSLNLFFTLTLEIFLITLFCDTEGEKYSIYHGQVIFILCHLSSVPIITKITQP